MDKPDGYYATATITMARRLFPWTMQSILSHPFKTSIITKNDFIWNVSLIYSFRSEYRKE